MKIVVCPDSFKGSSSAHNAAQAIARGIKDILPNAEIHCIPLADGGEGTVDAICSSDGRRVSVPVHDALMRPCNAEYGILPDGTAVIEMAAAAGLAQLSLEERNPLKTTTYGVGELICSALKNNCAHIILGIGGSATNDLGCGMAQALGFTFYDDSGNEIPPGISGKHLQSIAQVKNDAVVPSLASCKVDVACDVRNPLYGENGAAFTYAPQKGASKDDVLILDQGLRHCADVLEAFFSRDISSRHGAGAAGGLGAGACAFLAAELTSGIQLVLDALHFDEKIHNADIVISGEGHIDAQTGMGKVLSGVYARCQKADVPFLALAGSVDQTTQLPYPAYGIVNQGIKTEDAMASPEKHLRALAAHVSKSKPFTQY